jgi:dihydroorotate dehydrogenase (fumarate)
MSLATDYMGIKLKNPIVVSSSGLTDSVAKIKNIEDMGAGAVVVKSLFEEQIYHEAALLTTGDYPEAEDYIRSYVVSNSTEKYLRLLEDARRETSIPLIASINCITASEWVNFAREIEKAGADALELNVFFLPLDGNKRGIDYENLYNEIVLRVKNVTNIPVSVKIGHHFTNLVSFAKNLYYRGVKGIVLFNRFFEPDIDIDKMEIVPSPVFSSDADLRVALRWVAILSDKIKQMDIAASTGIHDGKAAIKQLLAGAKVTQICSVLYQKGTGRIPLIIKEIETWMDKQGFGSIEAFRGKMNYGSIYDPVIYERAQFMRYFSARD